MHFWSKFIRRDFLLENQIEFDDVPISCDVIFSFKCHCLAKSVRVPFIANIYRIRLDSNSQFEERPSEKLIRKIFHDTFEGAKAMYRFTQCEEFFQKNLELSYNIVDWFIGRNFWVFNRLIYAQYKPIELESIIREEIEKDPIGNSILMPHFFSLASMYCVVESNQREEIQRLRAGKS